MSKTFENIWVQLIIQIRVKHLLKWKNKIPKSKKVNPIKIKKIKKLKYSTEFKKISKSLKTFCFECNSKSLLQVHHKDKDTTNNDLSNLVCLCYYCHSKYHPHMQNKKPPPWLK